MNPSQIVLGKRAVRSHVETAALLGVGQISTTNFRLLRVYVHDIQRDVANATPAYALVAKNTRNGKDLLYRGDFAQGRLTSWVTLDPQGEQFPTDAGYRLAVERDYGLYQSRHAERVAGGIEATGQPQLTLAGMEREL